MTPIEKAQAKSAAMAALGLGGRPAADEIRAAWKRIAFRTHPDRNGGALDAFARARAAYDLLWSELPEEARGGAGSEAGTGTRPQRRTAMGRRPRVAARVTEFSAEVIAHCRDVLREERGEADAGSARAGTAAPPHATATLDHLPKAVHREGRCLTYVVATPLAAGTNRVALPTAILEDPRKVSPRIVSFRANASGPGDIEIPEAMRMRLFPGARSVRIRFAKE